MGKKLSDIAVAPNEGSPAPSVSVPSLGISKRWKTDKALLKQMQGTRTAIEDAKGAAHQRFAILSAYAAGEDAFPGAPIGPKVMGVLWGDPTRLTRWAVPMLQGSPTRQWLGDFAHDAAYAYWHWRIEDEALTPRADWRVFLERPTSVLARCLYLGWMEEARIVAESIRRVYGQRKMIGVSGKGSQPLNHLLLRVAFDYWRLPFDGWGKGHNPRLDPKLDPKNLFKKNECFGEAVLNVLYEHWRDADLSPFTDHLVWAADYTTHRLNSECEFAWGGQIAARLPGVLLPLARFRACLGLGMPVIPHPLMTAPDAVLPEPSARHTDPLLERVLERLAREELPALLG